MRILFVEDSPILRRTVNRALRHAGFECRYRGRRRGEDWPQRRRTPTIRIVLDIMLPKIDGLTLLRRLRAAGKNTHVLLLTARDTVADRVDGLRQGADDYLIKPFAMAELIERIKVLCRRAYGRKSDLLRIGALELELSSRRLRRNGVELELTAREWRLVDISPSAAARLSHAQR